MYIIAYIIKKASSLKTCFSAFFYLISKTNLSIMSIKPSVVYIKGVHDIVDPNPSTAPDIGFPNIGLDKLFEGAILKEYTGDYDPNKKFIYKENLYNKSIESLAQFTCLRDGYSIPPANVQEYFYKNGNNYVKHIVPDLNAWENKLNESNFIKDKIIYTISNPNSWTYVKINSDYYDCTNNGYDKKTVNTYHCYDIIEVDLEHEYRLTIDPETYDSSWLQMVELCKMVSLFIKMEIQ